VALDLKMMIRLQEIDHVERLRRACAERGIRMSFNGGLWTFRGRGVDIACADLKFVREGDLVPSYD
jgi:hypothetical protein